MSDNPLPRFFLLLREAEQAATSVDRFDLHSEDNESRKTYLGLLKDQVRACSALIRYCRTHGVSVQVAMERL